MDFHRVLKFAVIELTLGELGCTACAFESVFLSFLHSGVAGKESCLLEGAAEFGVVLKKCTGETVTDRACLTGYATACNAANDVELAVELAKSKRLTND